MSTTLDVKHFGAGLANRHFPNDQSYNSFLTVPEVAAKLRCSKAHVHNLINGVVEGAPPLPAIAVGRRRLVEQARLDEWIRGACLRVPVTNDPDTRTSVDTSQPMRDFARSHGLSEQELVNAILALTSQSRQGI